MCDNYYGFCYIAVIIFLIFAAIGFFLLKLRLLESFILGAVASFCYLNTVELPSKVTERDKAAIHIFYLINVILIIAYVLYSIFQSSSLKR